MDSLLTKYHCEDLRYDLWDGSVMVYNGETVSSFKDKHQVESYLKMLKTRTRPSTDETKVLNKIAAKVSDAFLNDISKYVVKAELEDTLDAVFIVSNENNLYTSLTETFHYDFTANGVETEFGIYPITNEYTVILNVLLTIKQLEATKILQHSKKYVNLYKKLIVESDRLSDEIKAVVQDREFSPNMNGVLEIKKLYSDYFKDVLTKEVSVQEDVSVYNPRRLVTNFEENPITMEEIVAWTK